MCGQIASRTNVLRVKAMTENPQDRSAQAAKLAESFGGKMEAAIGPAGSGQLCQDPIHSADDRRRIQGRNGEGQKCEVQLHRTDSDQTVAGFQTKHEKKRPPEGDRRPRKDH
jgi:hypothetical protein